MIGIRRALAFTFAQKYVLTAIHLVSTIVLARLLAPNEIGVFAVGNAVVSMTEVFRDFGVGTYLIQSRQITLARIRTAFTVTLLLSILVSAALLVLSGEIAGFYREAGVRDVLYVAAANFLIVPFAATVMSLLRRDMAFGAIARINFVATLSYGITVNGLAALGFGYMSLAWAMLLSSAVGTVAAVLHRPDLRMFRPGLSDWRQILSFGSFSSATAVLNGLYSNLPQLILGRILDFAAVGLYSRAVMLSQLFDRLVLDGVNPVVLPAFATTVRSGDELKTPYLRAVEYVTALQWPFLLCLALLADPIVGLLLGPQWQAVAPLVRIIALASLCLFPAFLTYPLLVAVGRVRDTLTMSLITVPASLVLLFAASFFGLEAVAASLFIAAPLQVYVALAFVRRQVRFAWGELALAVRKSAVVALAATAVPAAMVVLAGFRFDLSFPEAAIAGVGAILGWLAGLAITGHPLAGEISSAIHGIRASGLERLRVRLRPQV